MVELDPKLLTGGELKRFQVARYRRVRHVHQSIALAVTIETLERCDFSILLSPFVPQERVGVFDTQFNMSTQFYCHHRTPGIIASLVSDRPGRDWRGRQGVYSSSRPRCRKTRIGAGTRRCISSWTISVPSQSQVGSELDIRIDAGTEKKAGRSIASEIPDGVDRPSFGRRRHPGVSHHRLSPRPISLAT
jgi:hypothetical protein